MTRYFYKTRTSPWRQITQEDYALAQDCAEMYAKRANLDGDGWAVAAYSGPLPDPRPLLEAVRRSETQTTGAV